MLIEAAQNETKAQEDRHLSHAEHAPPKELFYRGLIWAINISPGEAIFNSESWLAPAVPYVNRNQSLYDQSLQRSVTPPFQTNIRV